MTQSNWVADRIRAQQPGAQVELVVIKTQGDILQDVSLAKVGGKGLFVKEIEEALRKGDVDFAVHSLKDLPVELPEGLSIAATTKREDPRDCLVSLDGRSLEELPAGALIGTGSLRRSVQLKNRFPKFIIVPLRGNLDTRLGKVAANGLDGVILAAAGIRRMGWEGKISQYIPPETMLPAVGQGILGIETRRDATSVREAIAFLNDPETACEAVAERTFLASLGGGCQLPIAGFARKERERLTVEGLIGSMDGKVLLQERIEGAAQDAAALGRWLAETLLGKGGKALLDSIGEAH
ncbi:MAG: hydroxymethylbilane synthase [Syntrophaceae bacterium]|nr:hydroxymethylbilane synthase [Syntrophaceae bacterium]